ncbi:glycosyltransferase [Candidatus Micrarchaeota archaeon]|nr:glycosyltransferase [Candidatus Micrarchaeota archaeon]
MGKRKIDVSVIVPAFNEEKYLGECLKSIAAQKTRMGFELIVSDGGSTDKTVRIAEKYADGIVECRKRGIWIGRNTGARKARGKVLVFVDADTRIPPNYLDAVHAVLRDERIAGVSCAFRFDEQTRSLKVIEELSNKYLLLKGSIGRGEILGFNNAVRAETFWRVGGFPDRPLEDGALAKELLRVGSVVFLPEPRVITSSRRMKKGGTFNSAIYYANLMVLTQFKRIPLQELFKYKNYLPIR